MSGSSHRDVLLAGAAAAFTVDLLVYPLDTLKTRQQSQDFVRTFSHPAGKTTVPPTKLFRGLYQGIGIVIVATLPAAGTFFTVYEAAKAFFGPHGAAVNLNLPQPLMHSAASATAEMASCLVLTPAEVIKQNAQMLQRRPGRLQDSTSMQALRQLAGPGAARKLLAGYTAMVARNLPFTALQFPIFEALRKRMWARTSATDATRNKQGLLETGYITGASAALAGSFAAVITTPMDVVKTRMMVVTDDNQDARQGPRDRHTRQDPTRSGRGALYVARQVLQERGIPGLFRGSVLRAIWTAVGSGLYLGMYEVARVSLIKGRDVEDAGLP